MNDQNFGGVEYITSTGVALGYSATATSASVEPASLPAQKVATPKQIRNAVYAHVRAQRALGRTQVLISEIAAALSLPESVVVDALTSLRGKGVRVRKR